LDRAATVVPISDRPLVCRNHVVRDTSRSSFPGIVMSLIAFEATRSCSRLGSPCGSTMAKAKFKVGLVHRSLRDAGRDEQALIDRLLLRFDFKRPDDYRVFLRVHFDALSALEGDWREQDADDFCAMIGCLQSDLQFTPLLASPASRKSTNMPSLGKGLGTAYAIRGSRLGSAVVRRAVPGNQSRSYLDFVPALSWTEFLSQLDAFVDVPEVRLEAAEAARDAASVFSAGFMRTADLIQQVPRPKFGPGP
jgi:heme oxygenase